ncbi:MAG: hypothetical protein ACI4V7_00330 [Succinivibrionaceae bacterium]
MKTFKIFINILLVLATIGYPFVVYYAFNNKLDFIIPIVLMAILITKFFVGGKKSWKINFTLCVIGLCLSCLYILKKSDFYVLMYPLVVNIVLLLLFGHTLIGNRKSFIESIASLTTPIEQQTNFFKKYCQVVTYVWCVFFIINGTISYITAEFCSKDIWTIYNGIIAYILIGIIFTVEYIVRITLKKRDLKNDN